MNFDDLLQALTPERYQILMRAVELGKWQNGRKLSQEERESSLQVLIGYDAKHKQEEDRIGFVPTPKSESECENDSENLIVKN